MSWGAGAMAVVFGMHGGCATTRTAIVSQPRGASVELDDRGEVGRTPMVLKEETWAWTEHTVVLKKEGYATKVVEHQAQMSMTNFVICSAGCLVTWMVWPLGLAGAYPNKEISVTLVPLKPLGAWAQMAPTGGLNFKETARPPGATPKASVSPQ